MTKIDTQTFLRTLSPNLKQLISEFKDYGFEIRMIGGAVRDVLMGQAPRDIDLATNAQPTEIMFLINEEFEDLEAMTTWGIRHGTIVVAFSEEEQYEITSLDFRIEKKGKKIIISQTPNWKEDAFDRDFTVNTMSMDLDGKVYDYMNAQQDLKNQEIKFVNKDPEQAIKKDPLLILRFFKLVAKFDDPKFDKKILDIIKRNVMVLTRVKSDTLKWFISNIKEQTHGDRAFELMEQCGIEFHDYVESTLDAYINKMFYHKN